MTNRARQFALRGVIKDTILRDNMEEIARRLNETDSTVMSMGRGRGKRQMVNSMTGPLTEGTVYGLAATGRIAEACALSTAYVRALFTVDEVVPQGGVFEPLMFAPGKLRTDGSTFSVTDSWIYLSTTPGRATSTRPGAPNKAQIIGKCVEEQYEQNFVDALIFLLGVPTSI